MFKNYLSLTCMLAITLMAVAQVPSSDMNKPATRTVGLSLMTDIHSEQDFESTMNDPQWGFDFFYNRKKKGRALEHGFSLGWQPIETTDSPDTLSNGTTGHLRATNQMVHSHVTTRVTMLKDKPLKPYVEGIAGFKGAALTSFFNEVDTEFSERELQKLMLTYNLGYAIGFRWKFTDRLAADVRYARITSGDLQRVVDVEIDSENNLTYSTDAWKVPIGYFRIGVSMGI
jgi:hypothetical protein